VQEQQEYEDGDELLESGLRHIGWASNGAPSPPLGREKNEAQQGSVLGEPRLHGDANEADARTMNARAATGVPLRQHQDQRIRGSPLQPLSVGKRRNQGRGRAGAGAARGPFEALFLSSRRCAAFLVAFGSPSPPTSLQRRPES
jgi:hypothetical protein